MLKVKHTLFLQPGDSIVCIGLRKREGPGSGTDSGETRRDRRQRRMSGSEQFLSQVPGRPRRSKDSAVLKVKHTLFLQPDDSIVCIGLRKREGPWFGDELRRNAVRPLTEADVRFGAVSESGARPTAQIEGFCRAESKTYSVSSARRFHSVHRPPETGRPLVRRRTPEKCGATADRGGRPVRSSFRVRCQADRADRRILLC